MTTNKGGIVKQSGNDVEGYRSQKVLFQPSVRIFLQYSVKLKITVSNQADGANTCQFIDNLDRHHKVLLLLGGHCLPFDNVKIR